MMESNEFMTEEWQRPAELAEASLLETSVASFLAAEGDLRPQNDYLKSLSLPLDSQENEVKGVLQGHESKISEQVEQEDRVRELKREDETPEENTRPLEHDVKHGASHLITCVCKIGKYLLKTVVIASAVSVTMVPPFSPDPLFFRVF